MKLLSGFLLTAFLLVLVSMSANACPDKDRDGVCNSDDVCPLDNPDDTDNDGVCDSEDPCPLDRPDDANGDGVCDTPANSGDCSTIGSGKLKGLCNAYCSAMDCEGSPSASTKACNAVLGRFLVASDGVQPPCVEVEPPVETDSDNDGIADHLDNCPTDYNPDQANSDIAVFGNNDLRGDACDNCPDIYNIEQSDTDQDGVGNRCDNCAFNFNPDQEDTYGVEGRGDACEPAQCVPDCGGKQCGSDGCGGSCGSCVIGNSCSSNFMCVSTPEVCNGVDDDADGEVDEGLIPPQDSCSGGWQCNGDAGWACP
ncbi:MAG: thrombospondin type 3 repeat-containing protein [Halioglobus sp.]